MSGARIGGWALGAVGAVFLFVLLAAALTGPSPEPLEADAPPTSPPTSPPSTPLSDASALDWRRAGIEARRASADAWARAMGRPAGGPDLLACLDEATDLPDETLVQMPDGAPQLAATCAVLLGWR